MNRLPGVSGSCLALYNPLTNNWGEIIMVAGHAPGKMSEDSDASWDRVSADYLQNLGVGGMLPVATTRHLIMSRVVNETFVKRFFKSDEDPLGQHSALTFHRTPVRSALSVSCATRSSQALHDAVQRGRCFMFRWLNTSTRRSLCCRELKCSRTSLAGCCW